MAHYTGKDLNQLPISDSFSIKADIVLVGAGVSSLYLTWQLLKNDPNLNIVILEQLGRIGGRLDSDVIKIGDKEVKEEQGGMRFTFDTMDSLMALIQMMNLDKDIVPFPMNSGGNNRLFFRGRAMTNSESAEDSYSVWADLYNLEQQEQYINPKQIINTVFNRILDVNPDFTERPKHRDPSFWQRFRLQCSWKGKRLIDWQLQGLLSDMGYSTECINLLYRLSGFNGTFLSTMNAGVAYQLLEDFPADPKFKTFKEGFSTLTNAMVDEINKIKFHGLDANRFALKTIVNRIEFKDIDGDEDKEFLVYFTNIGDKGEHRDGVIAADKVILGLPRLALERLFIQSNIFNILPPEKSEKLWNTLQTSSNQPLLKINLYYDKAWWGNKISGQPSIDFGPNLSDLPLGSVYPFYSISEDLAAGLEYAKWLKDNGKEIPAALRTLLDSKHHEPAALTIYCDFMNINFWKVLQNQGGDYPAKMQGDHPNLQAASATVVERATAFSKNYSIPITYQPPF